LIGKEGGGGVVQNREAHPSWKGVESIYSLGRERGGEALLRIPILVGKKGTRRICLYLKRNLQGKEATRSASGGHGEKGKERGF